MNALAGPAGFSTTRTYYANASGALKRQRPSQIKHQVGSTVVSQHDYDYDATGNLSSWQISGGAWGTLARRFQHDWADQLTAASGGGWADSSWSYDAAGNWISRGTGSIVQTREHNSRNQLVKFGGSGTTLVEGRING